MSECADRNVRGEAEKEERVRGRDDGGLRRKEKKRRGRKNMSKDAGPAKSSGTGQPHKPKKPKKHEKTKKSKKSKKIRF